MSKQSTSIKQHLIAAFSVLAFIAMFLPLVSYDVWGFGMSFTGVTALVWVWPILAFIGPIVLIIGIYVPKLRPYRPVISYSIPVACFGIILFLVLFLCGAFSFATDMFNMILPNSTSSSIGLGGILGLLSHAFCLILALWDQKSRTGSFNPMKTEADKAQHYCPKCYAPLAPGSTFCTNCGMPLQAAPPAPPAQPAPALTCAACRATLAPGSRFCNSCGAPTAPAEPPAAETPPASPGRLFIPPDSTPGGPTPGDKNWWRDPPTLR